MTSIKRLAAVALMIACAASFARAETEISSDAQAVLDQVRDGYAKLKSLKLEGTLVGKFDVAGDKVDQSVAIKSLSDAAGRFSFTVGDELVIASTGEKTFVFLPKENEYSEAAAITGRTALDKLPAGVKAQLEQQSCSLLIAISDDAGAALVADMQKVTRSADETLDGIDYAVLAMSAAGGDVKVLVDPTTHLVRRAVGDMKKGLEASGATGVKQAEIIVDYTTIAVDPAMAADAFAYAPPRDARLASSGPTELMAGDDESGAQELVGKDAPDFTATGLDGKPVKLSDLKGKVVVVDCWATWCPPCRAGLPHLEALYQKHKADGLMVIALNQQEEKDVVQKFIDTNGYKMPVFFDPDGAIAKAYKVTGIPQTMVIGKDGKVVKIYVGFGEGSAEQLEAMVEKALK